MKLGLTCAVLTAALVCSAVAQTDSCTGRCGDSPSNSFNCQCNSACSRFRDCCDNYSAVCEGNGGGDITPGEVTDAEISNLGNSLWAADKERFTDSQLVIDVNGDKLFTRVDSTKLMDASYALFISLLNNYNPTNGQLEPTLTTHEQAETNAFLDHVVASDVMKLVENLLVSKGKVPRGAMKSVLYDLWFSFYGRSSSMNFADSSGFEHVFVGEKKSTKVNGFHSWVQMYLLEKSGNIDYWGYNARSEPNLMDNKLTWDGLQKARASMFIGTSPEFDMALYTLCMIARSGQTCTYSILGNTVNIQTYDVSHVDGVQVATAFPMVR